MSRADAIKKAVDALSRRRILVGIPSGAAQGEGEKRPPPAVLGALNEFGGHNIPARPFLRPSLVEGMQPGGKILEAMRDAIKAALELQPVEPHLSKAGLAGANGAKAYIRDQKGAHGFPALDPQYQARKEKYRDVKGPQFGQLTGEMLRSITHKVE